MHSSLSGKFKPTVLSHIHAAGNSLVSQFGLGRILRMKLKATGSRGSWFAEVAGERLPCVHSRWLRKGGLYHDPNAAPGTPKFDEHFEAIRRGGRVILTKSEIADPDGGFGFARTEYVALFSVSEVAVFGTDLTFRLGARLAELE
jgi:hypothetical protein